MPILRQKGIDPLIEESSLFIGSTFVDAFYHCPPGEKLAVPLLSGFCAEAIAFSLKLGFKFPDAFLAFLGGVCHLFGHERMLRFFFLASNSGCGLRFLLSGFLPIPVLPVFVVHVLPFRKVAHIREGMLQNGTGKEKHGRRGWAAAREWARAQFRVVTNPLRGGDAPRPLVALAALPGQATKTRRFPLLFRLSGQR